MKQKSKFTFQLALKTIPKFYELTHRQVKYIQLFEVWSHPVGWEIHCLETPQDDVSIASENFRNSITSSNVAKATDNDFISDASNKRCDGNYSSNSSKFMLQEIA